MAKSRTGVSPVPAGKGEGQAGRLPYFDDQGKVRALCRWTALRRLNSIEAGMQEPAPASGGTKAPPQLRRVPP